MTLNKFDIYNYTEKYCCDYCSGYAGFLKDKAGRPICTDCFNKKYIKKEPHIRFFGNCSICKKSMIPRGYFNKNSKQFVCYPCYSKYVKIREWWDNDK